MSTGIGSLSVQLSLDAIQFAQGLDHSAGKLNSFAAAAAKTFAGIQAGASLGFAGYDFFKGGLESMVEEGRKARELGTSLNTLAALHRMAGSDAEQFDRAMLHLNRELQVAATAGGEAANKFASLHLDAAKLAGLPIDQKLGIIADRLNALSDGGERSAAAMEIFGERGVGILADLEKGSKGVADAIAKMKGEGGIGFNDQDVANAREAQKAMSALEDSFGKIKSAAISEFAPVVKGVAESLAGMVNSTGGLRGAFHEAAIASVDFLLKLDQGIIDLIPAVDAFVHKFDRLTWVADKLGWIVDKFDYLAQAQKLGKDLGILGGDAASDAAKEAMEKALKFKSDLEGIRAGLNKPGGGGGDDGAKAAGGGDHLDPLAGPIATLEKRLREQVSAFGLSGDALERYKLSTQHATDAQLANIDALLKEQESLKMVTETAGEGLNIYQRHADQLANVTRESMKFADAQDFAASALRKLNDEFAKTEAKRASEIIEQTASPLDKFKAQIDELETLKTKGLLTDQQFAAAAMADYKGLPNVDKIEHPGAAVQGSDAAYESILNFEDQGKHGDVQQQMLAKLTEMQRQQQTAAFDAKRLADAVERIFKRGV